MGADLYIKDMEREKQYRGFEVSKEAVDVGYFRDCYNDYGLLNFLRSNTDGDYSWWQWADKKKWFREDPKEGRVMTAKGIKEWNVIIDDAVKQIKNRKEYVINTVNFDKGKDKDGNYQYDRKTLKKKDVKYFLDWLDLLERFIKNAIDSGSEIIWSV